ncbi:O-antigen ligase family protein [Aquihabitans sp. McL0605]|uniref:O-antigen ligase family protein n=1 Tax=Aquihabitans sp. McL0605 TaxID=3415671 RepID=UPI003CEAB579
MSDEPESAVAVAGEALPVVDAVPREPEVDGPPPGPSSGGRELDLLVAAAALLLLVVYVPGLDQGPVTARLIVLAPLGAAGIVALVRLAIDGDAPARWAAGFLVAAGAATALSDDVRRSLASGFGTDRGWIFLVLFLGCYAAGRRRGPTGTRLLVGAVLIGLVINAAVAIGQVAVHHHQGILSLTDGRALGLLPNPVYLASLMAGAVPLAAWTVGRPVARWWLGLPLVTLMVAGSQAAGGRSGAAIGVVVALVAIRRIGAKRIALVVLAIALGLLLMVPLGQQGSAATRAADGGESGIGTRLEMWGDAFDRVTERPLLGWGPNEFAPATTPHISAEFARSEGPDQVFFDAHNVLIEQLFSIGIPGLVLVVGFAVAAGRRARGPLALFALGIALSWLLEPISIGTAPVTLLALGAADPTGIPALTTAARRAVAGVATAILVLVASIGAGRSFLVDQAVHRGSADASLDDLARARRLLPHDPVVSDAETQLRLHFNDVGPDARNQAQMRRAAQRTVGLEPDRDTWWFRLAQVEYVAAPGSRHDRLVATRHALERANELHPWSLTTIDALRKVSSELHDRAASARWSDARCELVDCAADPSGGG